MKDCAEEWSRRKRRFSEEFNRDAVRLVAEEKYSFKAAASAVGVSEPSLRAWHAKFVPAPPPCGDGATLDELKAENSSLTTGFLLRRSLTMAVWIRRRSSNRIHFATNSCSIDRHSHLNVRCCR